MKYKTLFRLALKLLGVYLFFLGLTQLLQPIFYFFPALLGVATPLRGWSTAALLMGLLPLLKAAVNILFGTYLFFGGKWIVDKAIPSNHPYCPKCAYDLTGAVSEFCLDCHCPIDPKLVQSAASDRD